MLRTATRYSAATVVLVITGVIARAFIALAMILLLAGATRTT